MNANSESLIPSYLQDAIIETFKVQVSCGVDVKATAVTSREQQPNNPSLEVISVIGLSSSHMTGSMALGFPKKTYLGVLEKMIGEKHDTINSGNADACSELLNIIYASARVRINKAGFDFSPAIPSTLCGKEVSLPIGTFNSFLKFTCDTEYGPFLFALSLKKIL